MAEGIKERYLRDVEPERYEMLAGPAYEFNLTRRDACRLLGGGWLLMLLDPAAGAAAGPSEKLSARLHIGEDGRITLLTGKTELGQGARTELAQVAAEELRVSLSRIRLVMGDTALVPDDGGTWGSLTTPQTVPLVRRAAAAARLALAEAAAAKLGANPDALTFRDGAIGDRSRRTVTYGELSRSGLMKDSLPAGVPVTPPVDWQVCGKSIPPVQGRDIVTGKQRYSTDLSQPGMLHGRMVRSPFYRGRLVSFQAAAAERLGARVVRDNDFLGVVARDPLTAEKAARAVRAEWTAEEVPGAEQLYTRFKQSAGEPQRQPGTRYPPLIEQGNVAAALARAEHKLEAVYRVAPIAHVPMEPRAAVAQWEADRLTVWYGSQAPFLVRQELAEAFRIPASQVRVISCDVGGGFGGKQRGDAAIEAARLAREAGKPVKVVWSREEEFLWSYLRPAGLIEVKGGATKEGRIIAWDFRNYNSGAAGLGAPYNLPDSRCAFYRSDSPLRQGSYRSLAAVANTFAREAHIDELAALCGLDPVESRLRNTDNPRLRAVIDKAATSFGWSGARPAAPRGVGMAANIEKGGHLALFVALAVRGPEVKLERMTLAFECGAILNPDNLRNQLLGSLVMGIGGALFEEARFDSRRMLNPRLSAYRVPRFSDVPEIEVILVDRRDQPSAGAGEAAITGVAPAIAAAIHHATGKRLRALPLESVLAS